MITKILKRLLLLLLLIMVGERESWAYWRNDIAWQAINRISNDGGTFTTASNAANTYALALVDLSGIDGIGTVGTVNIQFYCYIPSDSRWMIGFGDKNVRGMTANGSNKDNYNTDGLYLRFGENKGNNTFNVNGVETAGSPAIDKWLRVNFSFNRIAHTYSYSIEDAGTGIPYYSGYDIATFVSSPTIIEAYSWMNGIHAELHNVTVTFGDFYFPHGAEIAYIEDLSYTLPLFNGTGKTPSYTFSTTSYFRQNGTTLYPKTTTGSDPSNLWEGDPIAITANADGEQPTTYYLRFKTRSWIDPASLCTSNTFDAGTTLGMFSSNTVTLDGMTLSFSKDADIPVVRSINGDYGVTIIDGNGYNFGNIDGNGILWGTVYKIETTAAKKLHVTGYFSDYGQDCVLLQGTTQVGTIANPRNETLAAGTFDLEANKIYYLYATPYTTFALKSLSYTDAYFEQSYAITDIPADGHYQQTVTDMAGPVYSIVGVAGDLVGKGVTINSSTGELSGITAGGAIKVQATGGGKTVYYVLTVAYPATDYPGHVWNFYEEQGGLNTSDGLKAVPVPTATTDSHGDLWTAIYKNATGEGRNPEWYHNNPVEGDNAFIVEETAGLVFQTGYQRFYLRNDNEEFTHVGIRDYNASLTIPRLQEGDIVEIMWRHDASGSGSQFTATNVKDLRGKVVNEEFEITESAERTKTRYVGAYSFIATGGDVTFTLRDNGNCDIQSIRIYKGPYRPTMRDINLSGNEAAPTTMLLDNAQQGYTYNYCNQLYSTATGPAMYVLKGYRPYAGSGTLGVDYDHEGCVKGSNAAYNPEFFIDEDAYPVSDKEKTRLYELRKNIVGLEMYNDTWKSSRNSYNNGVIKATSGWGKITIRMNNYTNDMKYVIGYTPDYTLTIGSKPHQTYPYTWDFTKIAGQTVTGNANNVLYSIEAEGSNTNFSGTAPTNWFKNANGQFMLNTDNSGDLGSQYVPSAVLVTQDRALSNFNGVDHDDKWAKDELDGLGFDGGITMHIDHLPSNVTSRWNRATVADQWNSLLSFKITDAATFVPAEGTTPEEHNGTWSYSKDIQDAGSGQIQLNYGGEGNPIDESSIPSGGIGFRLDEGETKYIHVIPSSPLQAGDVISVTAYNAYSNRDAGISFNKSASSTDAAQWKNLSGHLVEETINYTVSTNDGLDRKSDFYLYRHENTVHITAIEISRKTSTIPNLDWSIYTLTKTTITVPDLNANGKQDWIYVSASAEPESVTNATKVTEGTDGPDANAEVHKYKVTDAGNALLTFAAGTKIYKIGVTHILKDIHQVGNTGWATEIRKEDEHIDHELIGYFTKNDVNAYTVKYDSYDLNTATVALTPINEDGYVPGRTGVVMKLDNAAGLSAANAGKNVPLFYPSYTRPASSTPVDFPTNNLMYNVEEGIDSDNRNYYEKYTNLNGSGIDYTKFVLTNIHWTFHLGKTAEDEQKTAIVETDAAGFYRLHIWENDASKNVMPAHNAFLLVPTENLPTAVWSLPSAARRRNTIAIRTLWGEETTAIEDVTLDTREDQPLDKAGGAWYTLSGMRLQSKPTVSGVYIHDGKKVVVSPRVR